MKSLGLGLGVEKVLFTSLKTAERRPRHRVDRVRLARARDVDDVLFTSRCCCCCSWH